MSKTIGWARRLKVAADTKGLVGHSGAVLLRRCADQAGLTTVSSDALRVRGRSLGWDRGVVLVQLAVVICLGATAMADIAALDDHAALFGAAPRGRGHDLQGPARPPDPTAETPRRLLAHIPAGPS